MSFWGELRRRNVFKVGVAYLIVAWLLIQVAGLVFPQLQLPAWAPTFVTVLLIIGFPVALVLAWAYEITPEGVKQTRDVPLAGGVTATTGRKLDFIVIALLVVALGFVVVDQYVLEGPGVARAAVPRLAVLPCENLSPEARDAYFAAQMHEEILNQLAKLSGLRVIARTSVMQYATSRPAISQIASSRCHQPNPRSRSSQRAAAVASAAAGVAWRYRARASRVRIPPSSSTTALAITL